TFQQSVVVEHEDKKARGTVMGTNGSIFPLYNVDVQAGRVFSLTEGEKAGKGVVLGNNVAEDLFDSPADAINKQIKIQNQRYRVIGVIESIGDPDMQVAIIIPYKTTFLTLNP